MAIKVLFLLLVVWLILFQTYHKHALGVCVSGRVTSTMCLHTHLFHSSTRCGQAQPDLYLCECGHAHAWERMPESERMWGRERVDAHLSLQHFSVTRGSILLRAVGSPYGQAVRLTLLLGLSGCCAVSTFNRHPSSSDVRPQASYLKLSKHKIQPSRWDVSLLLLLPSITIHHAIINVP